ncbi:MAG: Uma2 family endonuclease [Microscillaceae bacterium]|nr:Uma2 family endonuclease [Microscillaceae bacterium]
MQLSLFPDIIPNQLSLFPNYAPKVQNSTKEMLQPESELALTYPESDGKPMAENTEHYDLLTMIKSALDVLFEDNPEVFIAGDLLWYPVKGDPKIKVAPDVMVALGRPKGRRGAYVQYKEGGVAPQVIFEILSPGNSNREMQRKHHFYSKYGVVEYFVYHTKSREITLQIRVGDYLVTALPFLNNQSALLGIRLEVIDGALKVIRPDGSIALTYSEQHQQWKKVEEEVREEKLARKEAEEEAKTEREKAEAERLEKERAQQEAEAERLEKERALAELELLRELLKRQNGN